MKSHVRLGIPFIGLSLLACGDTAPQPIAISSGSAALTAAENSERSLQGVIDAASFLAESASIAQSLDAVGGGSESCITVGMACPPSDNVCPQPVTTCESDALTEADLQEIRDDFQEAAEDLTRALRERVLIPANLESETDTSATYRLGASILCDDSGSDDVIDLQRDPAPPSTGATSGDALSPPPPPPSEAMDPQCVEDAERLQLRLRLTSLQDGDIDATLLVGAAQHAPLSLQLYRSSLGVSLDLAELLAAARDVGEAPDDITTLEGVVQARLVQNAERDYSFQVNVLEAVSIAGQDDEGQRLSATLGANSPTLEVRADGNAQSLTTVLDMASFHLVGPLSAFADMVEADSLDSSGAIGPVPAPGNGEPLLLPPIEEEPEPESRTFTGVIDLLLAGLSGTLTYAGDTDSLAFSNLGLGDASSVLSHNGNDLLRVDLNADAGRRFDLLVESLEDSGARVTFTPSFDMQLKFAFQHVADQFDDLSGFILDDVIGIAFEGNSPTLEIHDERVQVTNGSLSLTSAAVPTASVVVTGGQCLLATEEESSSHDWLGEFSAGVCE
jgi:hypothetical protein